MEERLAIFATVIGLLLPTTALDCFAAMRGNGSYGNRDGSCLTQQAGSGGTVATRPAGSQRRDGTFLTTGVTANGSTTRYGRGKGFQDGSRISTAPSAVSAPTQ